MCSIYLFVFCGNTEWASKGIYYKHILKKIVVVLFKRCILFDKNSKTIFFKLALNEDVLAIHISFNVSRNTVNDKIFWS